MHPDNPPNGHLSPGLVRGLGAAFELKYQLSESDAAKVEAWALKALNPDPHGQDGVYQVASVYCDTPNLDVFHRSRGYRRSKFRLRRYGLADFVHLERKSKKGDKVKKRRIPVPGQEINLLSSQTPPDAWAGLPFWERLSRKMLQPTCIVTYRRQAFVGLVDETPIRLTLDRDLHGAKAQAWDVALPDSAQPLLPGQVLLELKFHVQLPPLFHELLALLPAQPARVSKYRLCVWQCGLVSTLAPREESVKDEAKESA